ncbi:MAG: hypothetical protein K0R24_759 [Gammaproteobacteria bacterium]|jgi:hypothetical protein|nr:hypothetical protein [Gammaproteobacteria bacterium]
MLGSSPQFDVDSLAKEALEKKLLDIVQECEKKSPIIRAAIDESKRLMDISVTKNVPATKAILEQILDTRETILSTHANKIKEIDSVIKDIDEYIDEDSAKISKFEEAIEELEQIEKGDIVVDGAQILTLKFMIKERKEEAGKVVIDTVNSLTIRDCIEYMQGLENKTRESLESLKKKKQNAFQQKENWNTFTTELIQRLDRIKEEHLKSSYSLFTATRNTGKKIIEEGEESLRILERRRHAALTYRKLRFENNNDNLSHSSMFTPKGSS